MNAVLIGLSLVTAASAQVANGVSAIPMSMAYGYDSQASSSTASGGYEPPSASYTPPSNAYSAPPSYYTSPPSTYDVYSAMPYSSFTDGGYKSMDCGYGYQKQYDGSCSKMSWVCLRYSRSATLRSQCFTVLNGGLLRNHHHQSRVSTDLLTRPAM